MLFCPSSRGTLQKGGGQLRVVRFLRVPFGSLGFLNVPYGSLGSLGDRIERTTLCFLFVCCFFVLFFLNNIN